jgi:hypothetical protein
MATGFSATANCACDGTRLEVAQLRNLPEQGGAFARQSYKQVSHEGPPALKVSTTLRKRLQKKKITNPSLLPRTLSLRAAGAYSH